MQCLLSGTGVPKECQQVPPLEAKDPEGETGKKRVLVTSGTYTGIIGAYCEGGLVVKMYS